MLHEYAAAQLSAGTVGYSPVYSTADRTRSTSDRTYSSADSTARQFVVQSECYVVQLATAMMGSPDDVELRKSRLADGVHLNPRPTKVHGTSKITPSWQRLQWLYGFKRGW